MSPVPPADPYTPALPPQHTPPPPPSNMDLPPPPAYTPPPHRPAQHLQQGPAGWVQTQRLLATDPEPGTAQPEPLPRGASRPVRPLHL